ncbi:MAG: hypothetical protein ABEH81_09505 [Halopenitus sp.]
MSLSDRERPRAFEMFAVLSRARPYHLNKPAYKERLMAFSTLAVLSRAKPVLSLETNTQQVTEWFQGPTLQPQ